MSLPDKQKRSPPCYDENWEKGSEETRFQSFIFGALLVSFLSGLISGGLDLLSGGAISGGLNLLGGALDRGEREDANAYNREQVESTNARTEYWNQRQFDNAEKWRQLGFQRNQTQFDDLQRMSIRHRVADAKAAGLHPLYALGASGSGAGASGGPGVSFNAGLFESGNQSPTGSGLGAGIGRAGDAVASALDAHRSRTAPKSVAQKQAEQLADANIERVRSETKRNQVEAMAAASAIKRAEQEMAHRGLDALATTPVLIEPRSAPARRSKGSARRSGQTSSITPARDVAPVEVFGNTMRPGGTSADDVSYWYGDFVGDAHGAVKYVHDWDPFNTKPIGRKASDVKQDMRKFRKDKPWWPDFRDYPQ